PEGPFALGGWSYGVILAFEMAHQLRKMGREAALLVAFDLVPLNVNAPSNRIAFASEVLWNASRWMRAHPLVREGRVLQFAGQAWGKAVGAAKRRLSGTVPPSGPIKDVIENYVRPEHYPPAHLALMQTMLDVAELYVPERYDGAVQVYAATSEVPAVHFARLRRDWRALAPLAEVRAVSGTHRSMIEERDGQALAAHLSERLAIFAKP
ncbi:MAG TPA: thioesterase domain-containing protein, partial [Rhizomicrobium sp.]